MSLIEYNNSEHSGSRVELYLFESEDGRYRWGFTTDSRSRFIGPLEYKPEVIKRGELKQTAGDSNVEKLKVTLPFDNPVALIHVPYLPPRPIRLTIFAYERNDPFAELVQAFTGFVTSFNQKGGEAEFDCSQIIDNLSQTVPWVVFKSDCNWALYQIGCFVDKELYKDLATLSTLAGTVLTSSQFSIPDEDWYRNGFAVDPASGEQRFITAHDKAAGTITVVYPFSYLTGIEVIEVYAGCDRKKATCVNKFDNAINQLAFDHFPTYNIFQQGLT